MQEPGVQDGDREGNLQEDTMAQIHALFSVALPIGPARDRLRRLLARATLALKVHSERRALRDLDDRALRDMGFTRGDAVLEGARAFWDLPDRRPK
jgi:uncharacterized protein YjiS (DUF1127 family)